MRDLLEITRLGDQDAPATPQVRTRLRERLDAYRKGTNARWETLRARVAVAM